MYEVKKFEDDGHVWKYVFHFNGAIAEAVLYRYGSFKERTVMCVSVQSGCPVGCVFCGTGKNFIRNLTCDEIVYQINYLKREAEQMECILKGLDWECKKFQIMFMSMGEPMLNWEQVRFAMDKIKTISNAQLLLSTVGIDKLSILNNILTYSHNNPNVGLQFSIHDAFDEDRDLIIPFKNKLSLVEIRNYGTAWSRQTNRPVYLNYCVTEKSNTPEKMIRLMELFDPTNFHFTFSVVCEAEEGKKSTCDMNSLNIIKEQFLSQGYNVRIFDPAGKDTIGGGCGQLWYVQQWMKENKK